MIERISISNYKSIQSLDIELKPINILIGANGVGKSNFVSVFELLRHVYNQRLQNYVMQRGGIDALLHYGRRKSEEMSFFLDFDNINAYQLRIGATENNEAYVIEEVDFYNAKGLPKDNKDYDNWSPKIWAQSVLQSVIKSSNENRAHYLRKYLSSYRIYHFHDTSRNAALKQFCNVNDNEYLKEDGANLAAYLYHLSQCYPECFNRINSAVRNVVPFWGGFNLRPNSLNPQQIQIEWFDSLNPDYYLTAHQISDGSLRVIALMTLLNQPNLPPVIIIDEPELGLHPTALGALASKIKAVSQQETQFIIATQSAEFISNFAPQDIITISTTTKQNQTRETVFKRLSETYLQHWLDEYTLGELWKMNVLGARP